MYNSSIINNVYVFINMSKIHRNVSAINDYHNKYKYPDSPYFSHFGGSCHAEQRHGAIVREVPLTGSRAK